LKHPKINLEQIYNLERHNSIYENYRCENYEANSVLIVSILLALQGVLGQTIVCYKFVNRKKQQEKTAKVKSICLTLFTHIDFIAHAFSLALRDTCSKTLHINNE
jgi:hypothetical protein